MANKQPDKYLEKIQKLSILLIEGIEELNTNEEYFIDICTYFIKNKVSFIDIYKKASSLNSLFFKSAYFQRHIENEKKQYDQWLNDFKIIKNSWDKKNIRYLFHKSVGSFPHLSDNLDVLVETTDFIQAGIDLKRLNYINLRNIQEEHKEFYRKFIGKTIVGPIHLHERVCWVVPYENIDELWKRKLQSKTNPIVFYPGYEDSILINTAHCLLEDHIIKLKDILYIKHCIENKAIDWSYIIKSARESHWEVSLFTGFVIFQFLYFSLFNRRLFPDNIINIANKHISIFPWVINRVNKLKEQKPIMPFKIPHLWVRRHTAMREYKDPSFGTKPERLYQIFSGLVDRFLHLKLKIHNQPGMIISISGLDGAGKSSHIDSLVNAFTICEIKTMTLWTRAGSLPITKFFTKINHVSAFRNNENEVDKVHIASPVSSFKIYIWKLLNILDFLIYYGIFVRIQKYLNRVVICDRYFIDTVVDMESYNRIGKINRFLYKLYKALIPEPDLVLFIKVDPRNIKKRNKSTPTEDFRFNHTLYEKLIKTNKVLIVDNSDRFDLVSTKLIKTTLSKYFSRYPEKSQNYKTISFKFK